MKAYKKVLCTLIAILGILPSVQATIIPDSQSVAFFSPLDLLYVLLPLFLPGLIYLFWALDLEGSRMGKLLRGAGLIVGTVLSAFISSIFGLLVSAAAKDVYPLLGLLLGGGGISGVLAGLLGGLAGFSLLVVLTRGILELSGGTEDRWRVSVIFTILLLLTFLSAGLLLNL